MAYILRVQTEIGQKNYGPFETMEEAMAASKRFPNENFSLIELYELPTTPAFLVSWSMVQGHRFHEEYGTKAAAMQRVKRAARHPYVKVLMISPYGPDAVEQANVILTREESKHAEGTIYLENLPA